MPFSLVKLEEMVKRALASDHSVNLDIIRSRPPMTDLLLEATEKLLEEFSDLEERNEAPMKEIEQLKEGHN